ncbi:hypothetical protein AKJ16_DCAP24533 [Drosera capensis]
MRELRIQNQPGRTKGKKSINYQLQTTRFLYGCAVNAFILRVKWVTDSIKAGSVLLPDKVQTTNESLFYNFPQRGTTALSSGSSALFCQHGRGCIFKSLQWMLRSLEKKNISLGVIVTDNQMSVSRHLRTCATELEIPILRLRGLRTAYMKESCFLLSDVEASEPLCVHSDDAPQAFSFQHEVEGLVDVEERGFMSDELLELKLLVHVLLYDQREIRTDNPRCTCDSGTFGCLKLFNNANYWHGEIKLQLRGYDNGGSEKVLQEEEAYSESNSSKAEYSHSRPLLRLCHIQSGSKAYNKEHIQQCQLYPLE